MRTVRLLLPGILVLALFMDNSGCYRDAHLVTDKPRAIGCVSKSKRKTDKLKPAGNQLQPAPAKPGAGAKTAKGRVFTSKDPNPLLSGKRNGKV